jgi:eukaryotic-like serine/threonine-protein kinase
MPVMAAADGDPEDLTGRTLGDYLILRKLGQGAMGQVYLARQQSLKREVALKILRAEVASNPTAHKRFQAEAEAVASVTHANIVQVYAVGEFEGLRFMALEFVDGRNLRDYLARKGPPDLPVALSILRQIASALQRASEIGLVHRDIKPENILVTRKVEVKVADFGLSRYFAGETQPLNLTQSGMTLGTPLYMSPEQVQGQAVDHRSDIYSFGITAYHLLAGQPPFTGTTPFDVAIQHVQNEAPALAELRPDLPPALCEMVHRMMAKKPDQRYQTAREIIRDLTKVQKGLPVAAAELPALSMSQPTLPIVPGPGSRLAETVGYNPSTSQPMSPSTPAGTWAWRLIGLAALVFIAIGGWWLFDRINPPISAKPIIGLPETRPPAPVTTSRERELVNKLKDRAITQNDFLNGSIELGLLLIHERRLDEADKVFITLEKDRPGLVNKSIPILVAKIGQGIVLAHRDKATDSNKQILDTLYPAPRVAQNLLDGFLLQHPDFAEALAEALNRNAENLGNTKMPPALEWLRTPAGIIRGPKS